MSDQRASRGQKFPKRVRLLRSEEFRRVLDARCSTADGMLVVYGARNECAHPRLGLVVSRGVGPAVVRNQWKRSLREAFRLNQHRLPSLDLVCIPRKDARPDMSRLVNSLGVLARRLEQKLDLRELPTGSDDAEKTS
jgi:ribonuclease P protein component